MLPALQFLAALASTLFAGAALYINIAEHPARMGLDPGSALAQWAPSYQRATWMQAPLAVLAFLAGTGVWLLNGDAAWIAAALCIGAVVPFTFIVIMPVNRELLAGNAHPLLLQRWNRLHAVRSAASAVAAVIMLWRLVAD